MGSSRQTSAMPRRICPMYSKARFQSAVRVVFRLTRYPRMGLRSCPLLHVCHVSLAVLEELNCL
eukprot:5334297-Amphidinium_carterae.2